MSRRVKVKRVVPGPVCRVPDAARDGRRRRVRPRLKLGQQLSMLSEEAFPCCPPK